MGRKRAQNIRNDIVCACISIKRSVCDMHAPYRKILTETKLITCESPTTLDMRSRRIRHGNTRKMFMRKFNLHQRSIYRSFVIEELSISDRVSFSQLFGCVTKNAQTQCQCVGSKFIASKTQETHSRGNTALLEFLCTGSIVVLLFNRI